MTMAMANQKAFEMSLFSGIKSESSRMASKNSAASVAFDRLKPATVSGAESLGPDIMSVIFLMSVSSLPDKEEKVGDGSVK